jgi:hemoglobin
VPNPLQLTMYEAIGGEPALTRIVHRFYQGVAADPVLRAVYPQRDLTSPEKRLRLFLIQYWGGPDTYSQLRGHPRLRMRHMPFRVTPTAKEHWLAAMRQALDEEALPGRVDQTLWNYFLTAADAMVNSRDE